MRDDSDLSTLISNLSLFRGLDLAAIELVARFARLRTVAPKEHLYWQGDAPEALYQVMSGQLRRAIVSFDGAEKLIEVVSPGDMFGLTELVAGVPRRSSVAAVKPTTVVEIRQQGLDSVMRASAPLAQRVMIAIADRHLALEHDIATSYFHSGCRRLLDYLLGIAGSRLDAGHDAAVVLPLSKGLLAERLGVTPETLSRAFRQLSAAGLISVRGGRITLSAKLAERRETAPGNPSRMDRQERRHSDAYAGEAALALPLGSRAWL